MVLSSTRSRRSRSSASPAEPGPGSANPVPEGCVSGRDETAARARILDAAEALFYERGVQSVGVDDVRTAAGVSLKRLYQLFPAKDRLVVSVPRAARRPLAGRLADFVAARTAAGADPAERILAVFDWLGEWFAEPGFRDAPGSTATASSAARHPPSPAWPGPKTAFRTLPRRPGGRRRPPARPHRRARAPRRRRHGHGRNLQHDRSRAPRPTSRRTASRGGERVTPNWRSNTGI